MRRAGLLVLLLASLSITTAFAASFEVRAEDITSFSTPVDIATPTTKRLYLVGPFPSRLSDVPATEGASNVHSKSLKPGGLLASPGGELATNPDPATYHDWTSDPLGPVTVQSPTVELYITQTGAAGDLRAGLFDCDGSSPCAFIAQADGAPAAGDPNLVVVTFPTFSRTLDAGDRLLLRVVNTDTKAYNIQWGYKVNRPARLVVDLVPSG